VRLVLLIVAAVAGVLSATPSSAAPPSSSAVTVPALAAQPPGGQPAGGWNFGDDDEEEVPSFAEDLRAQARDIGMMAGYLILAFVSFFRKSRVLKYATFAASIGYIGFYKSQLMSIVNVFGLFGGNLPVFRYSLAWYLLATVTLVSTVLWGRVYCGRICAFGALTQTLDVIIPPRFRVNVPRALEKRASYIKFGVLTFALVYFLVTKNPLIYPYIEPFWMFGIHGRSTGMWVGLAVLLTATLFVRNLYCRFLCPLGAFLGVLSFATVFRIKRWSECGTCKICQKACEWGAIEGPAILKTECVRCDDCERLYADEKKCPHHLIIIRKADILARRAARPSVVS
jgi:NosR/NirI family transcriptional regulator, nitrous oxide reductase regulator